MGRLRDPGLVLFCAFLLATSLCVIPMINADENEVEDESPFTYEHKGENGPSKWGTLKPEWKVCQTGQFQSPIDLLNKRVEVLPALGDLGRTYMPASAIIKSRGHDISVAWKGDAGGVVINGTEYKLLQCHWHTPSEHTVDGKRFDMELHMVHNSSQGHIAVVAMLFNKGSPDPFLANIINRIKVLKQKGDDVEHGNAWGLAVGEKGIELGSVNPWGIKLKSRTYYRYLGSLTVPPCTEGVIWTVLKRVKSVSKDQIVALRNAVHDGFEENARPTQDWDGRSVNFFKPKSKV